MEFVPLSAYDKPDMRSVTPTEILTSRLALLFTLVLLAGCEEIPDNQPKVIFEYQYVNYAWGYQNSGFMIDTSGNIRSFSFPGDWNYPDNEGYISAADMDENLAQCSEPYCKTGKYDMSYFAGKLENATRGKITDSEHQMCDAGAHGYAGYIYEPEKERYRYVFIRQTGDWYRANTSGDAAEIFGWLQHPCESNRTVRIP
jgi:hypothetical protein